MQRNNSIDIPQVQVILQIGKESIDLTNKGLMSLKFKRFLNSKKDHFSNILTELDMTLFDYTGYELLTDIQRNQGNMYLKYGFASDDNSRLSPVYKITPTAFKVVQDNRGITIGIGGFGKQNNITINEAESYLATTSIKDLLEAFAQRNEWIYREEDKLKSNKTLPERIWRKPGLTDFEFITSELIPVLNSSVLLTSGEEFYEAALIDEGGRIVFKIIQLDKKKYNSKVWYYTYGVDEHSEIINMTNNINYDWMLTGLNIKVPLYAEDVLATADDIKTDLETLLNKNVGYIRDVIRYHIGIIPEISELVLNVEFVDPEDVGNKSSEQIINDAIYNILNTLNTIELIVVGNPNIRAYDIINIRAVNKQGENMIQNGNWRVIGITENISISGYQTTLELVRETPLPENIKEVDLAYE